MKRKEQEVSTTPKILTTFENLEQKEQNEKKLKVSPTSIAHYESLSDPQNLMERRGEVRIYEFDPALIREVLPEDLDYVYKFKNPEKKEKVSLTSIAHHGSLSDLQKLMEKKEEVDLNERDAEGNSVLHKAVLSEDPEKLRCLLERGAPVDAQNKKYETALHWAVYYEDLAMVALLVHNAGADIRLFNRWGNGAIHCAAEYDYPEVIELMLDPEKSCDVTPKDINDIWNADGNNPFHVAIKENSIDTVRYLLGKGKVNIDCQTRSGFSPLICSVTSGYITVAKLLLEHGANLRFRDNNGNTALLHAIMNGRLEIVELLVEEYNHADLNFREVNNNGNTAWLLAVINGHLDIMKCLKDIVDTNARNQAGDSALLLAVIYGRLKIWEWLIDNGYSKLTEQDCEGNTAFLWTAMFDNIDVAKTLIENYNVDRFRRNSEGNTALLLAIMYGHSEMVQWLIDNKHADLSAQNDEGNNALLLATIYSQLELVRWLIEEKQVGLGKRNLDGDTALILAVKNNHPDIVKLLLEIGANINEINYAGCSAIDFASTQEMYNFLRSFGAEQVSGKNSFPPGDNKLALLPKPKISGTSSSSSSRFDFSTFSNDPTEQADNKTTNSALTQVQIEQLFANFCKKMSGIQWKLNSSVGSDGNMLHTAEHRMPTGHNSWKLTEALQTYLEIMKSEMTFELRIEFSKLKDSVSVFSMRFITPDSLAALRDEKNKTVLSPSSASSSFSSSIAFMPPPPQAPPSSFVRRGEIEQTTSAQQSLYRIELE